MCNYDNQVSELTKTVLFLDSIKKDIYFKSDNLKESSSFLILLRTSCEDLISLCNKIKDNDNNSSQRLKLFHLGEILIKTQEEVLSLSEKCFV